NIAIAAERYCYRPLPIRRRTLDLMTILVRITRIIDLVEEIFRLPHRRGQQRLVRAHADIMAGNLEEADLRHAEDFPLRLEAQELYERLLGDDVNARSHQRLNGRGARPGQHFSGELEVALISVALRNHKVTPPVLALGLTLGAKLMRPGHGVDTILGDAYPTARE